ncbi:hypothetical protein SUGI_1087830 [Cryptomeria japonica]|nr:hypothetical protein SUGI_1087830 [Cryptomeria japonica]
MGNSSIETDFFEACESGDMKQAKRLFGRRDFDPTKLDGMKTTVEGRSCLHVAVLAGDEVLLERLVKKLNQQKFTDEGDKRGDTALHLAVWKYRVDLVKVLLDLSLPNKKGESPLCIAVKFGFLDVVKELIDPDPETTTKRLLKPEAAQNLCKRDKETVKSQPIVEGDTSLHIAAKNKNEPIVGLLRKVHGVNKQALNSEGKTPLDVAREVTEYHESFRIIKKLTDYKPSPKPFMYCAPEVSKEKHERAREMVNKSFEERRETELVVAALLATMAFTAVFTVPGDGFRAYHRGQDDVHDPQYFINLLHLWIQRLWFYGCSVYDIGILLFIDFCGTLAAFHQLAMFAVGRARFHRLCGVPRRLDHIVEAVWERAETSGFLHFIRKVDESYHDAMEGDDDEASKNKGEEEHELEHGYNCSCSSSPCLRNVPQSV